MKFTSENPRVCNRLYFSCGFSENIKLKFMLETKYNFSSQDPGWHSCVAEGISYGVRTKPVIMITDKPPGRGLNLRDS